MTIQMYDAENVEFNFPRLRIHLKLFVVREFFRIKEQWSSIHLFNKIERIAIHVQTGR